MDKKNISLREQFFGVDYEVQLADGMKVPAINFDNAATTPPIKKVLEKIEVLCNSYASIGRGTGQKAEMTTKAYNDARRYILKFFNVLDDDEYTAIFVNNTTDAINTIADTLACKRGVVLTTRMEHHSNDLPWRKNGVVDYVEVDKLGRLDFKSLEEKLEKYRGQLRFFSITGASNVTGYVNNIHEIAKMVHNAGGKIVVDGAQLVPHVKVDMKGKTKDENIDFLVFSGHKLYAPFGSGVIVGLKEEFNNNCPKKQGGGIVELVEDWNIKYLETPERNEAGTPNFFGATAIANALYEIDKIGYDVLLSHEKQLFKYFLNGMKSIKNVVNYGDIDDIEDRIGIGVFNINNIYHRDVAKMLAQNKGISVRHGWFCAHPYCRRLMNLSEFEGRRFVSDPSIDMPGMIRVSLGPYNNETEVDIFLNEIEYLSKKFN